MGNRQSFAPGEWYHCYTRGIDKRKTFENETDYRRFLEMLYLANSSLSVHRSDKKNIPYEKIFEVERGEPLVSIGSYALMPNHFHILLQEAASGGITQFMKKLGISYAMYFNIKYNRVGNLFLKPFQSRHVPEDRYFQHVIAYIHLNPTELFESGWKEGRVTDLNSLSQRLKEYQFSSFSDFLGTRRMEKNILGKEVFAAYESKTLEELVAEAREYYREYHDDISGRETKKESRVIKKSAAGMV